MLIVRHLGTPNSSFLLASLDATVCVIQYYTDQWLKHFHYVSSCANCPTKVDVQLLGFFASVGFLARVWFVGFVASDGFIASVRFVGVEFFLLSFVRFVPSFGFVRCVSFVACVVFFWSVGFC